jgi:hypothetical protein
MLLRKTTLSVRLIWILVISGGCMLHSHHGGGRHETINSRPAAEPPGSSLPTVSAKTDESAGLENSNQPAAKGHHGMFADNRYWLWLGGGAMALMMVLVIL